MPFIASVSRFEPPNTIDQETTTDFARELFQDNYQDIERLLTVFQNGQIENASLRCRSSGIIKSIH